MELEKLLVDDKITASSQTNMSPNCKANKFSKNHNRPFHGLWLHLDWGANTVKITVNVWDFGPPETAITPLQRGGFPQRKCILKDICTEIIFMKYKEEIQVITTVNEFLIFRTNPSNQHYANYREIRSHMRRFIIRIYGRRTFFKSFIFGWMNYIYKTI